MMLKKKRSGIDLKLLRKRVSQSRLLLLERVHHKKGQETINRKKIDAPIGKKSKPDCAVRPVIEKREDFVVFFIIGHGVRRWNRKTTCGW